MPEVDFLHDLAAVLWSERHGGAAVPQDSIPSLEELSAWYGECPEAAIVEADRRLKLVMGRMCRWHQVSVADEKSLLMAAKRVPDRQGFEFADLVAVDAAWRELPEETDVAHPVAPLVRAWQQRPRKVRAETRRDRRVLPTVTVREHPEREAGMLFGGLHEERRVVAPELPLWDEAAAVNVVPLLDLLDAAGLPVIADSRAAPLPSRLFVRVLVSVRPRDRRLSTVRIALKLRELRDGLFPNGWQRHRDWPRLCHALLHVRDYSIHDGRGRWFPLALRYLPDNPRFDDLIVFDVAFPPGARGGATVCLPEMDKLSVQSASRWRAYIAAHSLTWAPGVTRVLLPDVKPKRWVWTSQPDAYPILTLDDRRRLAFGARDQKHRTKANIDAAFESLPGLSIVSKEAFDPRTGAVGWRLVPSAAVAAVKRVVAATQPGQPGDRTRAERKSTGPDSSDEPT